MIAQRDARSTRRWLAPLLLATLASMPSEAEASNRPLPISEEQIDRGKVPAELLPHLEGPGGPEIYLKRTVLTFEIDWRDHQDFETEIFVDRFGQPLVAIVKQDADPLGRPTTLDRLSPAARNTVAKIIGPHPVLRVQQELEWGAEVVAVKWQGERGVQELKVFDDGHLLFVELPTDEPIPPPVLELAGDRDVEALTLDLFIGISVFGESPTRVVLPTGWPVAAAFVAGLTESTHPQDFSR